MDQTQTEEMKEQELEEKEEKEGKAASEADNDEDVIEINAKSSESNEAKEESDGEKTSEEDTYKEKFYYLAAEMENMKRRFEREKENLIKFGNEKVLSGLIEVVDNLDRTLQAIENDEDQKVKNIFVGIDMVRNQFLETLKNNGLERINALGETFDPNFHEAMAQQPAEGKEDQEVIQVFQEGYKLNGRLLRAAKVVIANNG